MSKTTTYTRKAAVSVPQLKLTLEEPSFIKIDQAIKMISIKDKGEASDVPSVKVIDLSDGQIKELLLDMIPADSFGTYGDKLVGMAFEITKGKKVQSGKNGYHPYTIYEIDA